MVLLVLLILELCNLDDWKMDLFDKDEQYLSAKGNEKMDNIMFNLVQVVVLSGILVFMDMYCCIGCLMRMVFVFSYEWIYMVIYVGDSNGEFVIDNSWMEGFCCVMSISRILGED